MFNPRKRSQSNHFLPYLFIACLLFSEIASAAPSISLSKKSGPPTSKILVSGGGFKPNVGVDIFFDTKDKALVVTNGEGEFRNAGIYAPRRARPGEHWVTALERNNDKGAQEPFVVQTNWSQLGFDADGTRLNAYENVLNPKAAGSLDLNWSYTTGSGVFSSPAVVNGVVYFGSGDSNVYALNAHTGARIWNYTTGLVAGTSPAVANGVVYIGSWDNNLYALNAHTGAKVWTQSISDVLSSPAVANGAVYVGSEDGNIYALNARTGAKLWSYQTGSCCGVSSPAVANGVVYIGSADRNIYALNARTGAKLWSYSTGDQVSSSPSVANGGVYIASQDHNVYALNSRTGAKLWSYSTGDPIFSSTAVANGLVYFGVGSSIDALSAQTCNLLWSYETGGCCEESSPAVANGVVYVGSADGNLYALNARTGARLWNYPTGTTVGSSPAVANGVVYVGSDDSNLYAFRRMHGPAKQEVDSKRPDLKTLHLDFSLKVSPPRATPSSPEL